MARSSGKSRRDRADPSRNSQKATSAILDHLPPEVVRRRVLSTQEAARFCNYSVPHWRRLYRSGKVPKPIRLSARKYGWTIGTLLDLIDELAELAG
jgi:predicted DNA-binding transcriptional regulator AlpA